MGFLGVRFREGVVKFGTNVPNKMLRNAAICQGYSFYRFRVIKVKPTGKGEKLPSPPRLGLISVVHKI